MHWHHLLPRGALLAALFTLIATPAAFAGGWAITTLDELPATITAGETYSVGYTIRQHGFSPVATTQSALEIADAMGGSRARFVGSADGPAGHYVAKVHFPRAGEWVWSVDQAPFQPQQLGTLTVQAIAAPAPAPVGQPAPAVTQPGLGVAAPAPALAVTVPEPAPVVSAPELAVTVPEPAPVVSEAAPAHDASGWPMPLRVGLPLATILAVAIFSWRVIAFVRPGRVSPAASRA